MERLTGNQKTLPLPARTGTSSIECEKKRALLAKAAVLFSKELTEELVLLWDSILASCSVEECEYAMDQWMRNGKFFPKPANVLELVETYRDGNRYRNPPRYENQGKGYGEADVLILAKLHGKRRAHLQGPLSDKDLADLVDELDVVTGRVWDNFPG
jgi:hypothetical protein